MKILVTGGAGYIGSHTVVELSNAGYEIVIVDNLSNSCHESIKRIEKITGKKIAFFKEDLLNSSAINKIFESHKIDSVIHFAGLKAVGESVNQSLKYYENNISGTINLLKVMDKNNVKKIIFSSSATVYGKAEKLPIKENFLCNPQNPYGKTKYFIEEILRDLSVSDNDWSVVIFRYFNPIGAHPSGEMGEDPSGIPNNLLPFISQVAVGKLPLLKVFGNDYQTIDGTGVRDYIHVVDLALGHLAGLKINDKKGVFTYNLGTGRGYSVMEVISAFEKASHKKIPFEIMPRREGDVATSYADASLAQKELGWSAKYNIDKMCEDSWNWQSKNPEGYKKTDN